MERLKNKIAVITGASSGIGRALAKKFSEEGWEVAASARRENLLRELSIKNSNIHSFPLDVTNAENTKNTFKEILKKFGKINLCIFSAGTYEPKLEKEINEKGAHLIKIILHSLIDTYPTDINCY